MRILCRAYLVLFSLGIVLFAQNVFAFAGARSTNWEITSSIPEEPNYQGFGDAADGRLYMSKRFKAEIYQYDKSSDKWIFYAPMPSSDLACRENKFVVDKLSNVYVVCYQPTSLVWQIMKFDAKSSIWTQFAKFDSKDNFYEMLLKNRSLFVLLRTNGVFRIVEFNLDHPQQEPKTVIEFKNRAQEIIMVSSMAVQDDNTIFIAAYILSNANPSASAIFKFYRDPNGGWKPAGRVITNQDASYQANKMAVLDNSLYVIAAKEYKDTNHLYKCDFSNKCLQIAMPNSTSDILAGNTMVVSGSDIYIGGKIHLYGSVYTPVIYKINGTSAVVHATGMLPGENDYPSALAIIDGHLYMHIMSSFKSSNYLYFTNK